MADLKRQTNGNLEITFSIPWSDIQTAYDKAVDHAVSHASLEGFRPGRAPRNLVEPKLDKNQLYSTALQDLLPKAYSQVVKDLKIQPILNPKITINSGQTGEDWQFTAVTCEPPTVNLPNYKVGVPKLPKEPADTRLDRVIAYLRSESKIQVPDILVEEEANHRLAALVENITHLGLSVDDYLKSKKTTSEDLKSQTAADARVALEAEFILTTLQSQEKLADRKATLDFLHKLV